MATEVTPGINLHNLSGDSESTALTLTSYADRIVTKLKQQLPRATLEEIITVFGNKTDTKFGIGLHGAWPALEQQLLNALVVDNDQLRSTSNFLLKLISKDSENKYHIQLAFQFLRIMVKTRDWDRYLSTTLGVSRATDVDDEDLDDRGNGLLHEAAKTGNCELLERLIVSEHVNMSNAKGETPLHLAAEYGHSKDVKILLDKGAQLRNDKENCTPLHSAALSMEPNKEVAHLLITEGNHTEFLLNAKHQKTEDTALHCAVRNSKVTAEFIEELRSLDPLIGNKIGDTAFHVAAKSDNQGTFMAMMSTFAPTKCGWDVDNADCMRDTMASQKCGTLKEKNREDVTGDQTAADRRRDTLLDMCAKYGNVEAVASLIQNGADLRKGIFHTIILESVRRPDKIEKLKAVYGVITENVVLWHCLEKNAKCPMMHSDSYKACLKTELICLLTSAPYGHDSNLGAIDYAICLGAENMLMKILNTRDVYRFEEFGKPHNYIRNKQRAFSRYDVTNYVSATLTQSAAKAKRMPYLSQIIDRPELWRDTDILNQQPFRMLIEPFIRFVQMLYLMFGIFQLTYMLTFSFIIMPREGHKAQHLFKNGNCNSESNASNGFISVMAVVWPAMLLFANLIHFVWFCLRQMNGRRKTTSDTDSQGESLVTTILLALAEKVGTFVFCITVFIYAASSCHNVYLPVMSVAQLFGWLTTFTFFSGVTKEFQVFCLLLRDVIVRDIMFRFILVFIFTIIGFSFSIHVLRQTPEVNGTNELDVTVFQMFHSSFGLGDEILKDASNGSNWLKVVFAVYNCVMMIILINVLIAMVNKRYDDAMLKAENEWRFGVVSDALKLHDRWLIRRFTRMEQSVLCCLYCWCFNRTRVYEKCGQYFIDVKLVDRTTQKKQ